MIQGIKRKHTSIKTSLSWKVAVSFTIRAVVSLFRTKKNYVHIIRELESLQPFCHSECASESIYRPCIRTILVYTIDST